MNCSVGTTFLTRTQRINLQSVHSNYMGHQFFITLEYAFHQCIYSLTPFPCTGPAGKGASLGFWGKTHSQVHKPLFHSRTAQWSYDQSSTSTPKNYSSLCEAWRYFYIELSNAVKRICLSYLFFNTSRVRVRLPLRSNDCSSVILMYEQGQGGRRQQKRYKNLCIIKKELRLPPFHFLLVF